MSTARQGVPAPRITRQDLEARSSASQGLITQFAVAGVMLSGLITSTTAVPPAAPAPAQIHTIRGSALWSGNGLIADDLDWFDPGTVSITAVAHALTALGTDEPSKAPIATPAALVRRLWNTSGLTGEQMARLFGVSRRAVHLWVSGGRMNAANHERLAHLLAVIDALPGHTPAQRRAALLAPDEHGMSPYDRLRSEHASSENDISGTPWRPGDLLSDRQELEQT